MKKIFSKIKGFYAVFIICLIAVVFASVSFVTKYVKEMQFKNLALNTPYNYTEPVIENKVEEIPISKPENNIKKSDIESKEINSTEEKPDIKEAKSKNTVVPFKMIKPAKGEIIKVFSHDELIYSKTFGDYRVHKGIDIASERSSAVYAVFDGVIEDMIIDPLEGITIVINHNNSYKSIYKNLSTDKMVRKGESVAKGHTISGVGETAVFEAEDESHLHFELLKDDIYINPIDLFE